MKKQPIHEIIEIGYLQGELFLRTINDVQLKIKLSEEMQAQLAYVMAEMLKKKLLIEK